MGLDGRYLPSSPGTRVTPRRARPYDALAGTEKLDWYNDMVSCERMRRNDFGIDAIVFAPVVGCTDGYPATTTKAHIPRSPRELRGESSISVNSVINENRVLLDGDDISIPLVPPGGYCGLQLRRY